jgi:hypothetical protein
LIVDIDLFQKQKDQSKFKSYKMKKSNLILLVAIIFMSMTSAASRAQIAMNNSRGSSINDDGTSARSGTATVVSVNRKAENSFKKVYQSASGPEWSMPDNKSLVCRFHLNNIIYRAFYTPQGNWTYTISGYDGSRLNKTVAERIKSVYYNSTIVYVNQIDLDNEKTFYIVEIQDKNSIRKLRVNEDEMEVVQEFTK